MKTFFQSPKEEWSELEKRAFDAVQSICDKFGGEAAARYGAWDAMVWLSSQVEVQYRLTPTPKKRNINKKQ
jgi:hypothetical protein